jgi:hypothetical protein
VGEPLGVLRVHIKFIPLVAIAYYQTVVGYKRCLYAPRSFCCCIDFKALCPLGTARLLSVTKNFVKAYKLLVHFETICVLNVEEFPAHLQWKPSYRLDDFARVKIYRIE